MLVKRIAGAAVAIGAVVGPARAQGKPVVKASTGVPVVAAPAVALAAASIAVNPTWTYDIAFPGMAGSPTSEKAIAFHYEVSAPRDAASGMATGKRMHKPITIVKEWGASAPQLMRAMASGAAIPLVTIDASGPSGAHHTMKLTNARVLSFRRVSGPPGHGPYGELAMTFERIEMVNKAGKLSAADDWYR